MVDWFTVSFAFALGVGTFFSPCSVGLIPAYVAYYASLLPGLPADAGQGDDASPRRWQKSKQGAYFGLSAAAGILGMFTAAGSVVYWVRTQTNLSFIVVSRGLAVIAGLVAVLLIALGLAIMAGKQPSVSVPIKAPRGRSFGAMALFGAGFALASLGCTLPLFFGAVAQALLADRVTGLLVLASYGTGLAGIFFAACIIIAAIGSASRIQLGKLAARWVRFTGLILVISGAYVLYYYFFKTPF